MLNFFQKKSKVKAGKPAAQSDKEKKPAVSPLAGLKGGFKKLNSMDRKQAYTWGGIGLVMLVCLVMLAGVSSHKDPEDFAEFETRGYDLANMPFSDDEAEQYLLAAKYSDMQGKTGGLYSEESKAARQAEDAEEMDQIESEAQSALSGGGAGGHSGGYYGGYGAGRGSGRAGAGSPTKINQMNSAGLKSASGSGMSGSFGPSGDFSNFRSQNKGSGSALPTNRGGGSARKALYQSAQGSRAAAGLKDNKMLNAKKAMMGGNVKGSDAFMVDSNGVDLSKLDGANLDTNAPDSSGDVGGLPEAAEKAYNDTKDKAEKAKENTEKSLGRQLLELLLNTLTTNLVNLGTQWLGIQMGVAEKQAASSASGQVQGNTSSKGSANSNTGSTTTTKA